MSGWDIIREHMLPKIEELFYKEKPEYELRDDSLRYMRRRFDD